MKKIKFNRIADQAGITGNNPSPASLGIPKWFKKLDKYMIDKAKPTFDGKGVPDTTIKACPPFLDSLMNGYVIYTEYDINVSWIEGEPLLQWRAGGNLISTHGKDQLAIEQVPDEYSDQPLKFENFWQIITPPGYSVMFTHPQNRPDLPFQTISGIVETDTYRNVINFPFLIRKDFEGRLPAGTPIVQIHPFKRESWQMEIGEANQKEMFESQMKLRSLLVGGYKTHWWKRKEYR